MSLSRGGRFIRLKGDAAGFGSTIVKVSSLQQSATPCQGFTGPFPVARGLAAPPIRQRGGGCCAVHGRHTGQYFAWVMRPSFSPRSQT